MGAADSKLAFRKTVFRLYEDKNIAVTENGFWELFWTLPESLEDIFSLIGANDIRRTRDTARENIETLIDRIIEKMELSLKTVNFPSEQHSINHLLNCCRVLTRFMPFVFESQECNSWEDQFFWTPRQKEREKKNPDDKPEYDTLPSRGETLLNLTTQSLFLAGFTIPISCGTSESKVNYVIWESGIGSSQGTVGSQDIESNRTEVLRLLTVLLSKSMYVSPTHLLTQEDNWLRYLTLRRPTTPVLLCSLLNTVCGYDPTGWVPYNHVVGGASREQLVTFCLSSVLILLDYRSPQPIHSSQEIELTSLELEVFDPKDDTPLDDNVVRFYLARLHQSKDFKFLMDGFHRLMINPMTSVNTYLPGSTKRIESYVEVVMLCWKLLEINPRFIDHLLESDRILDLTISLLFYSMENKDKQSQVGLVRMCAFMLQTLSANKEYSIKLNAPFTTHSSLPSSIRIYAFNGTYADFLIISVFRLIASTGGKLSTLYPALILTLANISPHVTQLSVTSSNKLLSLFRSMSSSHFLLADEHNYILTSYLLEMFNNILHFQYQHNPNFIYALLLHHQDFQKLETFALEDPKPTKAGFLPHPGWLAYVKQKLPLGDILKFLAQVVPEIEKRSGQASTEEWIEYLMSVQVESEGTIYVRQFQWGEALMVWFRSMMWGQNYVLNLKEYGPWNGTLVKLFQIKEE